MLGKVVLDPDIFYALRLRCKPITRTFGIFKDIVKHFFSAKIISAEAPSPRGCMQGVAQTRTF